METIGRDLAEMQRVPLAPAHVAALRAAGTTVRFPAGEMVAEAGKPAKIFVYVEDGVLFADALMNIPHGRGLEGLMFRFMGSTGGPRVTKLALDVNAFALSRDGSKLAVALEVFPDCATLECTPQRSEAKAKNKSSGRVYDKLFVRHWDTWKDGTRSHLFVVPVAGGAPVDVTKGLDADAPSKPFGGAEEFSFASSLARGGGRDDDRLRIDHLAHDPPRGIGRRHQDRVQAQLERRHLLEIAEEDVARRVRARQRDAEPAQHGPEDRGEHRAGPREGEA